MNPKTYELLRDSAKCFDDIMKAPDGCTMDDLPLDVVEQLYLDIAQHLYDEKCKEIEIVEPPKRVITVKL